MTYTLSNTCAKNLFFFLEHSVDLSRNPNFHMLTTFIHCHDYFHQATPPHQFFSQPIYQHTPSAAVEATKA